MRNNLPAEGVLEGSTQGAWSIGRTRHVTTCLKRDREVLGDGRIGCSALDGCFWMAAVILKIKFNGRH
jgi:hypothetical protein